MITATIGGLTFSTADDAVYTIASLEGWFGSPPVKTVVSERPRSDGAFLVADFQRTARPITFAGLVLPTGSDTSDWRALASLLADGLPAELTVTEDDLSLSCMVAPAGSGASVTPIVNGMASYVLSLVAFDPVKYGPASTVSTGLPVAGGGLEYELGEPAGALFYGENGDLGRLTLTNAGTATTYPVFTVTGRLAEGFFFQRLDTGQTVRYDRIVPTGTDVQIDMRTGAVVVDGTSDGSAYLSRTEFFGIEPGASFAVQFNGLGAATGTPTLTAEFRDGFW